MLTYHAPTGTGKTAAYTDTYHARFVKLIPNEQLVEVDEFETEDPGLRGEMTITMTLADGNGATDLLVYIVKRWRRWEDLDVLRGAKVLPALPMYNQLLKRPFDAAKDTVRIALCTI